MSEINKGGAAFPINHQVDANDNVTCYAEFGMTLRDYFSAKALNAVIQFELYDGSYTHICPQSSDVMASRCYMIADAMLKARGE